MSLPFTQEQLDAMNDTEPEPPAEQEEENIEAEVEDIAEQTKEEEEELEPAEEPEDTKTPADDLFEMPKKQRKKRKPLSDAQKDKLRESLAKAREKSKLKRAAMKALRLKTEAAEKVEAKKHIKARKKKKMLQDAHLEVNAEESIIKEEQDMWNEDRITSLMNRTLDTYFTKRKEEKKTRENFPMGPQGQPYYMPQQPAYNQQVPQRAIPKPVPVAPRKPKNPYFEMFGLSAEDEDNL
jgi:hypothetical protein